MTYKSKKHKFTWSVVGQLNSCKSTFSTFNKK